MIHLISSSWVNTVRGIIAPISVAIVYVTVALKGAGLIEKAECMKHSAQMPSISCCDKWTAFFSDRSGSRTEEPATVNAL